LYKNFFETEYFKGSVGAGFPPGDEELQGFPMGVAEEGPTSQRNPTPQAGNRACWGQSEAAPALGIGCDHGDRDVAKPGWDVNPQVRPIFSKLVVCKW